MKVFAFALTALLSTSAFAIMSEPTAVDLIFSRAHLGNVAKDTTLTYNYSRVVSDPAIYGEAFTDLITVKTTAVGNDGEHDVVIQVFTGDRAREAQAVTGITANPMFEVYFTNSVGHFTQLTGADGSYAKHAFSQSLLQAKVEAVTLNYQGQEIPGYKISVAPYANDKAAAKMQGYENSVWTMIMSEKIPGEVAELSTTYMTAQPIKGELTETSRIDGFTGLK